VPYPTAHFFNKEQNGLKQYNRPHALCLECPFESTMDKIVDSARNTFNIMKIRAAFQYALNTLLCHRNEKRISLLGLIVGVRGEMLHWRPYHGNIYNHKSNKNNSNSNWNHNTSNNNGGNHIHYDNDNDNENEIDIDDENDDDNDNDNDNVEDSENKKKILHIK